MLGAIAGDIIGSPYEGRPIKTTDFPLFASRSVFTDDTVLTVAVADSILHGTDYATSLKIYGRKYPGAGYGGSSIGAWKRSDRRIDSMSPVRDRCPSRSSRSWNRPTSRML